MHAKYFDPKFIHSGDALRKNIRQYNIIKEFDNPSDELLREWGIYCESDNEFLGEMELDQYWVNKATQLPILSNIAIGCQFQVVLLNKVFLCIILF